MKEFIDKFKKENFKQIEFLKLRCVYGLFYNYQLVYIGSTDDLARRILSHMKSPDKKFDAYCYTEIPLHVNLEDIELELILKNQPKYNKVLPPSSLYISLNNAKQKYGFMTNEAISAFIRKHHLKQSFLLRTRAYYSKNDFETALKAENKVPC